VARHHTQKYSDFLSRKRREQTDKWFKLKNKLDKLGKIDELPSLSSFRSKEPLYEQNEEDWYHSQKWSYVMEKKKLILHATKLFNDPVSLKKFTNDQINQGLYCVAFGDVDLPTCLARAEVPLLDKIRCIQSFENLYKYIFRKRRIPDSAYMWWDWFREAMGDFSKSSFTKEQIAMRNVMFVTLVKILKFRSEDCQRGALHGLGHLKHSRMKVILTKFLKSRTPVNKRVRRDAEDIIAGKFHL